MRAEAHKLWSSEWAHLGHSEIERRMNRELCETCGAEPGLPCHTRTGRTHWGYRHAARMVSAMQTFNAEQHHADH